MIERLVSTHLKITLHLLVLVLSADTLTSAQTTGINLIAVVDLQRTIEGTSEFQRAAEKWTLAMNAETGSLSAKQEELRVAKERLAAGEEEPNSSASLTLVRNVNTLQREFDRMNGDVQRQLNDLRERLILPITANVDRAIRDFAEENSLALILDVSNPQVGLLFTDGMIDITAAIVDYIETSLQPEDVP